MSLYVGNSRLGLVKSQHDAVNERSVRGFGVPLTDPPRDLAFDELQVNSAYALTIRYFNGFIPPNPVDLDISQAVFSGGYAQPRVLMAATKVVSKVSINQLEVQLDCGVMLSHKSGPRTLSEHYILHRDGSVRYRDLQSGEVGEWAEQYRPTWEFTRFPVLCSVVVGGV